MNLWLQRWIWILALTAGMAALQAAEFRDRYADCETLTTDRGQLEGDNTGATVEAGEPRHGGKRPAHSLWISWVAPTNGLATLRLEGRGFDTLLGVYQLKEDSDDPPIRRLVRVVENDDDRDAITSQVQFGVRGGERYLIAVDGYGGATGPLVLYWELEPVAELIPRVTLVNTDRSATVGESVTLAVTLGAGIIPKLHWYFNDRELEEQEEPTLVLPNFQPANVGHYRVRVEVAGVKFFSESVELQISSEGVITALARNKLEDSLETPLQGGGLAPARARLAPAGGPSGLTRGYNGTQIFHTVYAGRDPGEPAHCGVAGGASYWFAYAPPESGTLELDTAGSAFDTVLAVYTYDAPLLGYTSLQPVECDNNGGADGRTSRLRAACAAGRNYLIVVDGVNGARGLTYLNYRLDTNAVAPVSPVLGPPPAPVTVRAGERVTLTVSATGTPPLRYLWRKGAQDLPEQTNDTLVLDPVQLTHADNYSVRVSNDVGTATMSPVSVAVWSAPSLVVTAGGSVGRLQFATAGPLHFTVESIAELTGTNWVAFPGSLAGPGLVEVPVPLESAGRFFRVRFD